MIGPHPPSPALDDADIVPRFEFRAWGPDLTSVADHITAIGGTPRTGETVEVYLPVRKALHVNPKVRHSVLDVKTLIDVVDGFERWEPRLKCVLPITLSQLVDEFFPLIGLAPPVLSAPSYEIDTLVSEVADRHPDLTAVVVTKTRHLYRIDECTAEISTVGIGSDTHHTVAIESTHLELLGRLRDQLGLEDQQNCSYPRMIQRLNHWIGD